MHAYHPVNAIFEDDLTLPVPQAFPYLHWAGIACISCLSLAVFAIIFALSSQSLLKLFDALYSIDGAVLVGSVLLASIMALCSSAYLFQTPYHQALQDGHPWKAFGYGCLIVFCAHVLLPLFWLGCEWLAHMMVLYFVPESDFTGFLSEMFKSISMRWGECVFIYAGIVLGSIILGGLQNMILTGLYTRKRYLAL